MQRLELSNHFHCLLLFLRYYCSKIVFGLAFLLTVISLICLLGCSEPSLSSFTEYIGSEYTAAAQLNIEQSCLDEVHGQQVIVTWSLPSRMRKCLPVTLYLWVYYGSGKVEKLTYEVNQSAGYRVYCLKGLEYKEVQGIISYRVALCSGNQEIISRRHHLWMEVISLDAP
ncbi:acyl-CoA dehydrogenase [Candidatus Chlamydia corallus]|uniref:acyl-CoA dehydrogenase n=1 Tax=Candidatus Chlamydia corallus TaxID=2038470 RepID=UPI000C2F9B4E